MVGGRGRRPYPLSRDVGGERRSSDIGLMVSFDVKSLFNNIPVDEALEVVQKD